jgi:hypothetical protein
LDFAPMVALPGPSAGAVLTAALIGRPAHSNQTFLAAESAAEIA